jgi:uncharacterized protein involved in outer membrane biogenesis
MLARLFVVIGGLFVLALTVALVGPYFIDWTSYRGDFEREASAILGRKVTVHGDASARILPFPSVTFSDVVVGESKAEPAMTVETFSMDAELAPFMSGEFRIFDMRLVRPKATVTVGADGTIDWAMQPSAPIAAKNISLEKLTVTEGQVTIHHAASGRDHRLTEINMSASARSLVGPWRADGSLRADGQEAALTISSGAVSDDGSMRLRLTASPALYPIVVEADGGVRLDEGAATYAGTFKVSAKEEDTTAELRGNLEAAGAAAKTDREAVPGNRLGGTFSFTDKRLDVESFRFETGPLADPYVADGKAYVDLGAAPRFSITADGAQLRMDETAEKGGRVSGQSIEQRLAVLQEALANLPKPSIPGTVEVNLPAIVAGDTMIRDVKMSAEPQASGWTVNSLGAVLPGRATVEAKGFLNTQGELGFKGDLLLAVAQPSGFMAWLSKDVDEAIRRLPRAGFSAEVELTAARQSFRNLELQLGSAKFRGEIDSKRSAEARPSMLLKLDGGAVDFDGLSAFTSLFVSDAGANRFAETDLDFAIKAGPVSAGGLSADSVDTAIRLREGTAEVDRLTIGGLAGATISATATLKDLSARPTGHVDASVVSVDLQPLLDMVGDRYPDQAFVKALRDRGTAHPGLFADSEIDLIASAADEPNGTLAYTANVEGVAGGTSFTGSYAGPLGDAGAEISLSFAGRNDDATSLLALYGVNTLPLGLTGRGETVLSAKGSPANGLTTSLTLTGESFAAGFEGDVAKGPQGFTAKGRAALQAADIEPWMMTAGLGLPGMGLGTAVDLKTDADFANGLLVLSDVDGTVAEGAVAGDINLEVKEGVPHLAGQIALDEFDLYPIARMILGNESLESADSGWADTPFQQKSLAPFTADLDIAAGSFSAGPIATVSDAQATLRLDAEGMRVSQLSGKFADGAIGGHFELKNNAGTGLLTAQLKLANADVAQLAQGPAIEARGDFSTALSASGKTIDSIVASLSGSGTATLRDLTIKALNPDALPALIAGGDKFGRDIDALKTAAFAPQLVGTGEFAAGNADIAFTIAGGVLRAPPISFDRNGSKLTAEVRADLNDGAVAADGTLTYAAGDEALVGSEPAVNYAVSGPFGATTLTFDTAPLAQFLTQRALEIEQARVEAMQADLLEKQRLRREVRYYAALQSERDRLAEEQRRAEEAVRLKVEEAARIKAEEDAAKAQADEKARLEAEAKDRAEAERQKKADESQSEELPQESVPLPMDRDAFDTGTAPEKNSKPSLFENLFNTQ